MPDEGVYVYVNSRFAPNAAEYINMAGAGYIVAGDQNDTFSKGILECLVWL